MAANSHSLDLEEGSSQYASIADASQSGLDITGDMTIEFWYKMESVSGDYARHAVSKWNYTSNQKSYNCLIEHSFGTDRFRFNISSTGSDAGNASWTGMTWDTNWHHIAVTWDASTSTAELFIDGVSQGTSATGALTSCHNGTADFLIGANNGGATENEFFDGLIDEVRIWDDIRTDAEIADNDETDVTGQDNLQGYWKLNNDYTDETANGNDLTATASPVFSTTVPFANYAVPSSGPGGSFLQLM